MKCGKQLEFVIGGFTVSDKQTEGVSSLLLGVYEEGEEGDRTTWPMMLAVCYDKCMKVHCR